LALLLVVSNITPTEAKVMKGLLSLSGLLGDIFGSNPSTTVASSSNNVNTIVNNNPITITGTNLKIKSSESSSFSTKQLDEETVEKILVLLQSLKRVREQFTFSEEQLEDVEGSEFKRVKDTDLYYDTETKLLVDPQIKVALEQMDDVEVLQAVNQSMGVIKVIEESP
jgi:hypothetical protein